MKFFHRLSDEEMAKSYADDIAAKANALVKENEDREVTLRLKVMTSAIEKDFFMLFFNSGSGGFTIYSPMDKAEQAQDIVRSIMAAMHMQEANEESYKGTKNDKHPGYA